MRPARRRCPFPWPGIYFYLLSKQFTLLTLQNWARLCAKSSGLGIMLYLLCAFNLLVTNPKDAYWWATTCIRTCLCSFVSIRSTSSVGVTASPYSLNSSWRQSNITGISSFPVFIGQLNPFFHHIRFRRNPAILRSFLCQQFRVENDVTTFLIPNFDAIPGYKT